MLNPWLFTGFIDGEGYFSVGISKNKVGWQVKLEFGISLHTKDRVLLEQIQRYFSAGSIFFHPTQKILHYRIRACLFFPFLFTRFTPNPCITAGGLKLKRKGKIFKQGIELLNLKARSDIEGIRKIVSIKASMNWGLSRLCLLSSTKKVIH